MFRGIRKCHNAGFANHLFLPELVHLQVVKFANVGGSTPFGQCGLLRYIK
jgi:hypothetical protein